jgi:hypothetical protein
VVLHWQRSLEELLIKLPDRQGLLQTATDAVVKHDTGTLDTRFSEPQTTNQEFGAAMDGGVGDRATSASSKSSRRVGFSNHGTS